jgi:quinol monooxygenase YgiN
MVIVAGWIDVEENDRTAYLEDRVQAMIATRSEQGCVEYVFSPDPIEKGRVRLFELWQSRQDLDRHLDARRTRPQAAPAVSVVARDVSIYETSSAEALG